MSARSPVRARAAARMVSTGTALDPLPFTLGVVSILGAIGAWE